MRLPFSVCLKHAVLILALAAAATSVGAQTDEPHLPPAPEPRLPPGPSGTLPNGPLGIVGSVDYLVTSAANEHGAYLWIVGPSQHIVILCEKGDPDHDFACKTKRLP